MNTKNGPAHLYTIQPYYKHMLDLKNSLSDIFSGLKQCNRRNIKKAEKSGIKICYSTTFQYLKKFYWLNCLTRKKHGLPPQPFSFFRNIREYVLKNNMGYISLAFYNNKAIAGAVFFHFRDKALFKYGASDPAYNSFRSNNLVLWDAIKMYKEKGCKSFSFGRTSPHNHGLLNFKNQWGAVIQEIYYYSYPIMGNARGFKPGASGIITLMKYFPIPLLRIIGDFFYSYMG